MAVILDPSSQNLTLYSSLVISRTTEWKLSGQSSQENLKLIEFWEPDRHTESAIKFFKVCIFIFLIMSSEVSSAIIETPE